MASIISNFISGGVDTSELTATPSEVMKGYIFLGSGSDDEQTGTLELTGSASENQVLTGTTFYSTNPQYRQTGSLVVSSIFAY